MKELQLADIERHWDALFMDVKGKKPTVRLTELVKSKWPKLYSMAMRRQQAGIWEQVAVTGLLDQSGIEVINTEWDCDCVECSACERREDRPHDVDVLVKLGEHEVPMQVGVIGGTRLHDDDVVDKKYGAVDMKTANKRDTERVRHKIRQTPLGGITLLTTTNVVSPGDDWWYEGVDGRCVVLWRNDPCLIYYGAEGCVDAAKELCNTLGCKHICTRSVKPRRSRNPEHKKYLLFRPRTADGLADAVRKDAKKWTSNPDDVIGVLYYPAYASAYFDALRNASDVVQMAGLVPILRHVVERHRESVAEATDDEEEWRCTVSGALIALEDLAKADDAKLYPNVLVEICRVLQDITSRRHDDYVCRTLLVNEIDNRLHLQALFCLTHMVYRLRDRTPPEVRELLTAAARIGGQEGMEHRIVLGYALAVLRSAMPDWYAENESLLFGEDSPDGMNLVLMRVCSHIRFPDGQTMEKYHALVLGALAKEIQDMMRWESETGNRLETNDLVKNFMLHVLHGSRGYGIEASVQGLARIGPDAVSVAGHECGFLITDENTEKKFVDRGVRFWEAVLDSSPEPAALYGFGWWGLTKSVDQDTWERLMLCTCEAADGLLEVPAMVIDHASSDGNPTKSGIRIIELILRTNRHLCADLAVSHTLGRIRKNSVSIDIPYDAKKFLSRHHNQPKSL